MRVLVSLHDFAVNQPHVFQTYAHVNNTLLILLYIIIIHSVLSHMGFGIPTDKARYIFVPVLENVLVKLYIIYIALPIYIIYI